MLKVEPLFDGLNFGCVVRGVELKDLDDEAVRQKLRDLWIDKGLVIFLDCDISNTLHIELSKVFGRLERHFQEENLVEGHPELVAFTSDLEIDGAVEVDGQVFAGYVPWHRDFHWQVQPNAGGILRIRTQPDEGGDTGFIDMIDAYNALPEKLKQRAEGVEVVCQLRADDEHYFRYYPRQRLRRVVTGRSYENIQARFERGEFKSIAQPLVYTQKETGRKVLNFAPMTSISVLSWDLQEGIDFLQEIAFHVTDPARTYFHNWTYNDMALWDNRRMLHLASGVKPGESRIVWRTTIAAEYPIGRKLEDGGWQLQEMARQPDSAALG